MDGRIVGIGHVAALAALASLLPSADWETSGLGIRIASFFLGLGILARPLWLVVTRHQAPIRQLRDDVLRSWPWALGSLVAFVAIANTVEVGGGLKRGITDWVPFYADPFLTDLDIAIFGTDPWRLSHAAFGGLTRPIEILYGIWHPAHLLLGIWIAMSRDLWFKVKAGLTFQLSWILLGGILATASASVGPIMLEDFYGSEHFKPLTDILARDAAVTMRIKDNLVAWQEDPNLVSGISAMPSMHVAIATLTVLCVRQLGNKWLSGIAWTYLGLIYLGSIHLGWHYATDGIVSAALVGAIWWLFGVYVSWLERKFPAGNENQGRAAVVAE